MFGLEKEKEKKDGKPRHFEFDLEKDLKGNPEEKKRVLGKILAQMNQLKKILREGAASENFDNSALLLQAYAALKRTVERTTRT